MTDVGSLLTILQSGSRSDVVHALSSLTETERTRLGPTLRRSLNDGSGATVSRDREAVALIATAKGHRQAMGFGTYGWQLSTEFAEDAAAVLEARSPAWLPLFVEAALDDGSSWTWRAARAVVRAGLVETPSAPGYYLGMVRGIPEWFPSGARPIVETLEHDPELIGEPLIALLSTEGAGRLLAYHDRFQERADPHRRYHQPSDAGTWRTALRELAEQGRLDRARLIDTVLAAPLRDWAAIDLGWYVGMHDALAPGVDEVADRQGTYVRLLTVAHGPFVKIAQREVARLLGDARLDPAPLVDASRATLARADKGTVLEQLRLLDTLGASHPGTALTETVRTATDHPRSDVRDLAATILARWGASRPLPARATSFTPPPPAPRPVAEPVDPVESPDELADVLLGLVEEIDPVQMERAIDGLLRFADDRPATAALLLARGAESGLTADDPRLAAVVLADAWLTPRELTPGRPWAIVLGSTVFPAQPAARESLVGAVGRRLSHIAQAVHRGPHASVALPGRDGSLDADELSRRLAATSRRHRPPELELAVALLRVPGDERVHVRIPWSLRRSGVVAHVLDQAAPAWARQVVTVQQHEWRPLWRIPLFADGSGRQCGDLDGIVSRPMPQSTVAEEVEYGEYSARFEQTLALGALLLPHDPDVLAAHAHPYLHRDLRKDRAVTVPVLDALANARAPNGAPESSALVLGLAAKDARARTAAQDALLDLARHGLLDGGRLGEQAALHLRDGLVVAQRVSHGLTHVARADDAAVLPVMAALEVLLASALDGRKDAGPFIELAAGLSERTGHRVQVSAELRSLAEGSSSSAVARAVRRLG
ncbi:DUF6493 family protein [Cellulomonas soli]|uniref:DUF6493 family protein n=1 Tax=Cellulomonas soli TaxID=931535 RepID=UPI003F835EEF